MSIVKANIMRLTRVMPETVGNYNTLCSAYWALFDGVNSLDDISQATPAETITRAFRSLVSGGHIAVPEDVRERRKEAQKVFKTEFASLV